jgi:phosphoribosylaminoimidazolecarboxamide formyltransferase/IMP cyclohydrolase
MDEEERKELHAAARARYRDVVDSSALPGKINIGGEIFRATPVPVRYGLAPGTPARLYRQGEFFGASVANATIAQQGEKIRSYTNIEDWDTGLSLMLDLEKRFPREKFAAVMKHAIPFCVARAHSLQEAYTLAWNVDPIIPFGGTLALNDVVSRELAEQIIAKKFLDGIIAKDFDTDALTILAKKTDLRLMALSDLYQKDHSDHGYEIKSVRGGILLAERYVSETVTQDDIVVRSEHQVSHALRDAALFQWCILGYVRSNAAVFGDDRVIYGVGSGQGSRVDAIRNALEHAAERSPYYQRWISRRDKELVLATDGFPPEPDSVEACAKYGVNGFLSPIGSQRDNDVYKRGVELGLVMLTTKRNERPFTHR